MVNYLKSVGEMENTYVTFMSDKVAEGASEPFGEILISTVSVWIIRLFGPKLAPSKLRLSPQGYTKCRVLMEEFELHSFILYHSSLSGKEIGCDLFLCRCQFLSDVPRYRENQASKGR